MSVYTYYLLEVERSLRINPTSLITKVAECHEQLHRPCATVGLYCPGSAAGDEVGNSSVNANSDGVLGVCFPRQVAGNFILFSGK